ncbi:hypothetical protein H744_2c2347 [Photobacterium gaetbulicola Gung47]|uniref:Uncharacterized protein n=1 Tax=Photobacterium gaetbulicola Gung47 TaxID=658445 RepID=A0A0C5X108_9GAMM|nr:hypothetical protein H744_2c2347 [Photobacterium gaetbulicola Gung47]
MTVIVTFVSVFCAITVKNYFVGATLAAGELHFLLDTLILLVIYLPIYFIFTRLGKRFTVDE